MIEREYEIRDPFAGNLTVIGDTVEEAVALAYADIPVEERPAYVWYHQQQVPVPGGTCTPVQ